MLISFQCSSDGTCGVGCGLGSGRGTIDVFMGYEPVQKQRWTNTGVGYIDDLGAIVEGSTMGPIELRYQPAQLVVLVR